MATAVSFDRRTLMKWIGALPLLGYGAAQELWSAVKSNPRDNIYTRIGVRPMINAQGVFTYMSGALEMPEVRAAAQEAALYFVDIWELQHAVGKRLAEISGAEAGMVTAGAAAAMATGAAACMAGTDPARIWQLPDTTGMKGEVVMLGGRSAFDSAIRAVGAKLVLARTNEELQAAINENTAMVYTTARDQRLESALAITKKAGVPLFLDWASAVPPFENFSIPAKMGVDLYTLSGGKGLCGPQSSGVLLGRKDLIEAGLANSAPWEGAVCRAMKVGKEEIMGCLAAIETYRKMDLKELQSRWNRYLKRIAQLAETVPGVTTEVTEIIPGAPNQNPGYPVLTVKWDESAFKMTVTECARKLRDGEPRIEVRIGNRSMVSAVNAPDPKFPRPARTPRLIQLQIASIPLQPGEDLILGRRLREVLNEARKSA